MPILPVAACVIGLAVLAAPQEPARQIEVSGFGFVPRDAQAGSEIEISAKLKNATVRLLLANVRLAVEGELSLVAPEAEQLLFLEAGTTREVKWKAKVIKAGFRLRIEPHVVSEGRPMHGPPPAISEAARAALARPWAGTWTSPGGYVYGARFQGQVFPSGAVEGKIDWTLIKAPADRTDYEGKVGAKGVEFVWGVFTPETRSLVLEGYRREDPKIILGLDRYRLTLSEDHQEISGATWNHGTWQAAFRLNPQ